MVSTTLTSLLTADESTAIFIGKQGQGALGDAYQRLHFKREDDLKGIRGRGLQILPPELLGEVFWIYVYGNLIAAPVDKIPVFQNISGDPIRLSHVCSLWRSIVLSTPALWATIFSNTSSNDCAGRLLLHLSRSGTAPLTLTLQFEGIRFFNFESPKAMEAVALALAQLPRCRRLYIKTSWQIQEWLVKNLPPAPPLLLEEFSAFMSGWSPRFTLKLGSYLHSSPKLQAIRWRGISGPRMNTWKGLADNILRHTLIKFIELDDFHSFDSVVPLLRNCSALERLSLCISKYSSFQHPPIRIGNLCRLKLLTLSDLKDVFSSLDLPSLTDLTIDHFWDMNRNNPSYADVGWAQLQQMLERSGCKLELLSYTRGEHDALDPCVDEDAVIRALTSKAMDSLIHLTFNAQIGDPILVALRWHNALPHVLPNLKKLEFKECWSTDGVWSELVRSRAGGLTHATTRLRGLSGSNFCEDILLTIPGVNLVAEWDPIGDW